MSTNHASPSLHAVAPCVILGRARLYPSDRLLMLGDTPAPIRGRAFDVLLTLVERPRQLVTRAELLERVWSGLVVENNSIAAQVMALRKVLGADLIETVPGHGYRLNADPEAGEARPSAPARAPDALPSRPLRIGPRLYGRHDDVRALLALLHRPGWLTLTGLAGVGKTAIAQALAFAWYGPAVWIDLSALSQSAQVLPALARELGLAALDGPGAAALLPDALVVLDNAEHVRPGVAVAAEFIRRVAPTTRLLVTSLAPVGAPGEQVKVIEPLAVGRADIAGGASPDDDDALREGAIGLLVARIKEADRRLQIGPAQLPLLRELCRRLDGLPLAIEMAAARVPLLGLQGVREALDQRFALLKGTERRTKIRHPTLQTALDWSHDLLAPDEQALFRTVAVFTGGFDLQLVIDLVVAAPGGATPADRERDRWRVIDALGKLIDHSLVMTDAGEPPRYRLLETVRAYALERLRRAGAEEVARVNRRHAEQVLRLMRDASRAAVDAQGAHRETVRVRGLAERDNARAALDWCLQNDAPMAVSLSVRFAELALHLMIDVDLMAADSSWGREGYQWVAACEPLMARPDEIPPALQAGWWRAFALQLLVRQDPRAVEAARRARAASRALDDDIGLYWSSTALLRAGVRHNALTDGEGPEALADLAASAARHPDWPAAIGLVDVATRRAAAGAPTPGTEPPHRPQPWAAVEAADDRMPELRYYLATLADAELEDTPHHR